MLLPFKHSEKLILGPQTTKGKTDQQSKQAFLDCMHTVRPEKLVHERKPMLTSKSTKIIVTTGYGSSRELNNTELIDINGDCIASLPDYPMKIDGATGVYIDGKIIICGGGYPVTNKCYQLRKGGKEFELIYTMKQKRFFAKSIVTQQKMLLSGGHNGNSYIGTGEFINPQISNTSEPSFNIQLPEAVHFHAIVKINQTTLFLIGGETIKMTYSKKTHFYNHVTKEWTDGPELIAGRWGHTAGILIDHETQTQHIAVVGGFRNGNVDENSVELLLYGQTLWSQGMLFFNYNVICLI